MMGSGRCEGSSLPCEMEFVNCQGEDVSCDRGAGSGMKEAFPRDSLPGGRSKFDSSDMKARSILIVSLGLNVLLACWVVARAGRVPASQPAAGGQPSARSVPLWQLERTNVVEAVTNRVDAPAFHWSSIETNDFEAYTANLRGVGCPEHTVRHLVMGEIEEVYAERIAEAEESGPFWETQSMRRAREKGVRRQRLVLEQEKRSVLRRLLGVEWSAEAEREWVTEEELCLFLGFLPDEKAIRLMDTGMGLEKRTRVFGDETDGIVIDTDEPRVEALLLELKRDMVAGLSPAEEQEAVLRAFAMLQQFTERGALTGVSLTGEELRRMMTLVSRDKDLVGTLLRTQLDRSQDDEDAMKSLQQPGPEALAGIHAMLGEQRFADYQRSKDEAFREFARSASRHNLPKETAVKAYEIRRTAEMAAREVKGNAEMTAGQQRAALNAMRHEAQQAITAAVGAQAAKEFFREDRGWARSAFGTKEAKP